MSNHDENIQIDLTQLFRALRRNLVWILLSIVICGGLAYAITKIAIKPLYESTVSLYVNNLKESSEQNQVISNSDLMAAQSLVDTYITILRANSTMEDVIKVGGLKYSVVELKDMISAASLNGTEIFQIGVTCGDPHEAQKIASIISEVLPLRISEVVEGSSVRIVDQASLPKFPSSPVVSTNVVIGAIIGLVLSCLLIIIITLADTIIRSEEYINQQYKTIPVLATIPDLHGSGETETKKTIKKTKSGKTANRKTSSRSNVKRKNVISNAVMLCERMDYSAKESYRLFRTNLMFTVPKEDGQCVSLGVTSSEPGEGKSTTSINLCYSLSQLNKRVLLINCDMRKPSIEKTLKLSSAPGLSNMLIGANDIKEYVQSYTVNGIELFHIISCGDIPPNPAELLESKRMEKLLEYLKKYYNYIILDLPPVDVVSDPLIASKLLDGVIVTVRTNHTRKPALKNCIDQLQFVRAHITGIVMNATTPRDMDNAGKYYGKYYGRRYGKY